MKQTVMLNRNSIGAVQVGPYNAAVRPAGLNVVGASSVPLRKPQTQSVEVKLSRAALQPLEQEVKGLRTTVAELERLVTELQASKQNRTPSVSTSPNDCVARYSLGTAVSAIERIAADVLGASARVELALGRVGSEGEQDLVVEVYYAAAIDAAAGRAFLHRYIAEVPSYAQQHITVVRIPE